MEQNIKRFNINSQIIKEGYHESFSFDEQGRISLKAEINSGLLITNRLDSAQKGMKWGRIVIDADIPEDCEYYVYAMASDELNFVYKTEETSYDRFFNSKDIDRKEKLFILDSNINAKKEKNFKDILLGLEGRYLWLGIEIIYTSLDVKINNISVYFPGDSLIKYFPEIYRKNKDSFFERYLSLFSSLNKDYQRKVDEMVNYIDVTKAPNQVLELIIKWLGFEIQGGFLSSDQLRTLIKNAKYLTQFKGTVDVIKKVIELFIGSKAIVIEQIKIKKYQTAENIMLYQELYGTDPYEFIIILNQELKEDIFYQLKSLINMFKPARTKAVIIFLTQQCVLDNHCYIDLNARLIGNVESLLDDNRYIDRNLILAK